MHYLKLVILIIKEIFWQYLGIKNDILSNCGLPIWLWEQLEAMFTIGFNVCQEEDKAEVKDLCHSKWVIILTFIIMNT